MPFNSPFGGMICGKIKNHSSSIPFTGPLFQMSTQTSRQAPISHPSTRFRSENIKKAVEDDVAKALASVKEHMATLQSLDLEKALDCDRYLGRF